MSANIKCYDPASGRVAFQLSDNVARIISIITVAPNTINRTFNVQENGQIFHFWIRSGITTTWDNAGLEYSDDDLASAYISGRSVIYSNYHSNPQKLFIGVISI